MTPEDPGGPGRPKYEMPTVFGPSLIPDLSVWGRVEMLSLSFVSDRSAVAALVPCGIDIATERPAVTVSRMTYRDVDYLAGGGYNEVTIGVAASVDDEDGPVRGNYLPVVWVDEQIPIQIGREFLGYAKVPGEMPPVEMAADRAQFTLRERSTLLIAGRANGLRPVSPGRLDAIRRAAAEVTVVGWKYIPSLAGEPDADYPTRIPLRFDWDTVSAGGGDLTFATPAWSEAPVGARIVGALSRLPVLEACRSMVATGTGSIDRTAARRLHLRRKVAGSAG
jgi:acetoacetate decarboxylase